MSKKRQSLIDQIRQAARDCGMSQNGLARAAGLDPGAVNRFIHGERGLSAESLDLLADVLDLHIVQGKPSKPIKRRKAAVKQSRGTRRKVGEA